MDSSLTNPILRLPTLSTGYDAAPTRKFEVITTSGPPNEDDISPFESATGAPGLHSLVPVMVVHKASRMDSV